MKKISDLCLKLQGIEKKALEELEKAQRESAYDIGLDVRKLAPKDTGRYADSIKVDETVFENNELSTMIYTDAKVVSYKGNEYNLGYLLETGTSPHIIEPVKAKMLHFLINGEDVFTKRVKHPGTVAMPHFQPALEANKYRYSKNIQDAVRRIFNE